MSRPRRVVVVGGGTAGWIAANMLAQRWPDCAITLIESPDIATIGVGEGSTPSLRQFLAGLGLAEADWMARCQATYKTSIRFAGWSPQGPAAYDHPFTTQLDAHTTQAFFNNCRNRRHGLDVPTEPAAFLLGARLAAHRKAPLAPAHFPFRIDYGYHFDAALLGACLRDVAVARGVVHVSGAVCQAHCHPNGDIAHVLTRQGQQIAGDLFIDCSGFAGVLIRGKLGVGFVSFANSLFNDAAVVLPTPAKAAPRPQTLASALSAGWCWQIPLRGRTGNGYVYSSAHLSPEAAMRELCAHLGLAEGAGQEAAEVRHLRFATGRLARSWAGNVVAVGLAQGFVEPLEATALHLVLSTLEMFLNDYERGGYSAQYADACNARINARIDQVRDYIVAHYKLNTRNDTDYWRENRANPQISDALRHILDAWYSRRAIEAQLAEHGALSHFDASSWHCLLAGYGAFPPADQPGGLGVDFHAAQGVERFLNGCLMNFPDHTQALDALAAASPPLSEPCLPC